MFEHALEWNHLKASDFRYTVMIEFEDGSCVVFENAVARTEGECLVVYTKHLGHHVFPEKAVESVVMCLPDFTPNNTLRRAVERYAEIFGGSGGSVLKPSGGQPWTFSEP